MGALKLKPTLGVVPEVSAPLFIDFEFNGVVEPIVNLVSCATMDSNGVKKTWWLHNHKPNQLALKKYLLKFNTFVCYSAVAECRSFTALGIDARDRKFKWLDLFLEFRCLTNHNEHLQWGKQLVNGRVRTFKKPPPKWERVEGQEIMGFKPTHSLAEATYKLTGRIRDTEHKTKIRDLIISAPKEFSKEEQKWILEYNLDDVVDLPNIWKKMKKEYFQLDPELGNDALLEGAFERGRYAAHTANMEDKGYPVNLKKTKNFSRQVGTILYRMQKEINGYFPEIKPFRWNKKEQRMSENQKNIDQWIEDNHDTDRWMKTKGKANSQSLEAFEKHYHFKHDYPTDNFGAQMLRYKKLKQSLYGFNASEESGKKTFWDYVGSDGRVRPYMNIYKAQSSRSQPAAKGFMFLKPAWMRAMVEPKPGYFMAGIDYGSQEFFVSALRSGDENMIEAYLSGDPYFSFAKLSQQVPQDALRKDHEAIRDACKSTVLGISYLMTKIGLSKKLTDDTGREWTEEEAQEQIDLFYETFWKLEEYQQDAQDYYYSRRYVKLPCNWYMWGDNDSFRSVVNVEIQGIGASIMRKAVDFAHEAGVYIPFTLHDALYMEAKIGEEYKIEILRECMRKAFIFYFPEEQKATAAKIRLDAFAWSPDYKPNSEMIVGKSKMKFPINNLYIDKRAKKDYDKFSIYFEARAEDEF